MFNRVAGTNRVASLGLAILLLLAVSVRGGEYGTGVNLDDSQIGLDGGSWGDVNDWDWLGGFPCPENWAAFFGIFSDEAPQDVLGTANNSPPAELYEKRDLNVSNDGTIGKGVGILFSGSSTAVLYAGDDNKKVQTKTIVIIPD
ncbi:MAG: hypothetical protein NTY19_29390 [Planctomycetota bacterium]|nr:hypothetical protein [Planctomycetota bacterium]